MGISLKDFGSFAVGAIEEDKKNTLQRFTIRNEELQANRASLIKRKDARYKKDIEAYDAEKKKYDTLKSAASNLKDGTINPRTYAAQYLITTLEDNFTKLPDDEQEKMITKLASSGKTSDFTVKGNADEIEKKYTMQEVNINKVTAKALEDARGDSFLIKKIIGESNSAKKDLATQVETALKANENVLTTKSISGEDSSLVGIPLTGKDGGVGDINSIMKYNGGKWLAQYDKAVIKAEYNGVTQDKTIQGLISTGSFKEFDTSAFVKKEDGQVVGWTQSGDGFVNGYEQTYKALHDELDNKKGIIKSFNFNNIIGGADINTSKLNDKTNAIIAQRASKNKIDGNDVFSMLPIGVVGTENELYYNGKGIQLNNEQMSKALIIYNNFVKEQAIALVKSRDTGIFDPQSDENFIDAYNEIQANMSRNRINGTETNLAYTFKEKLLKDLNMSLPAPSNKGKEDMNLSDNTSKENKTVIEGTDIPILPYEELSESYKKQLIKNGMTEADYRDYYKRKTQKTKPDANTTAIKKEKEPKVEGSVLSYTSNGKDKSIDFSKLDENDVKQLEIKNPNIYKKYMTWNDKNTEIMKDVQAPIKGGLNSADFQSKHKMFKETYLKSIGR